MNLAVQIAVPLEFYIYKMLVCKQVNAFVNLIILNKIIIKNAVNAIILVMNVLINE